MRWADRPSSSLPRISARHGSQSLGRPRSGGSATGANPPEASLESGPEPMGALAGFELGVSVSEPMGALAGFELGVSVSEPMGALAGFDCWWARWRWRATVSR